MLGSPPIIRRSDSLNNRGRRRYVCSRGRRRPVQARDVDTVGHAELNKFLLVITAEAEAQPASRTGPTVLHGTSPSGWLQSFLSHPLFRGEHGFSNQDDVTSPRS